MSIKSFQDDHNPQFVFASEWSNLVATKRPKRKINESETKDMPQSLSSILIHLIFSTKQWEPFITREIETELHPYLASIFRGMKCPTLALDGTEDHIHALFSLSRVISITQLVEEVKTESSKWVKTKGREFGNFHWQNGYGAFFNCAISTSNREELHLPAKNPPSTDHVSG